MLHERQQRRETRSVKQAFSNRLSSFSTHFNVKTQILHHLGRSRIQRFDLCPPALFPLMSVIITPQHGEKNTQSQNINIIKPKHYDTLSQKGWYIFKNVMDIKPWFIYLVRRVYRELICMLSHIFPTKGAPGFWKWNTSYDSVLGCTYHTGGVWLMWCILIGLIY